MLEPLTDANITDVKVLRRIMSQPIRDTWPGINQPYQEEDDDDGN